MNHVTVELAKKIIGSTQLYNISDYKTLKTLTQYLLSHGEKIRNIVPKLITKMQKDKAAYEYLLQELLKQPDYNIDYYPLKSSLQKLLGLNACNKKIQPGIIDQSIHLLLNQHMNVANGLIHNMLPTQTILTIYKYICINLLVVSSGYINLTNLTALINQLKLIYTIQLHETYAEIVKCASIFSALQNNYYLHIPNAGYIFGGNIQGTHPQHLHRGLDCSGYVYLASYYLQQDTKQGHYIIPSTRDVEIFFNLTTNGCGREAGKINERVIFLMTNYAFVQPDNIVAGDIIIWRTYQGGSSCGGHAAVFAQWVNKSLGSCTVYEAVRLDNCSKEGIFATSTRLKLKNSTAYILRRKLLL